MLKLYENIKKYRKLKGMSLEAIARRLGHSSSAITKQIYFHVTEKLKARDEEAMSRVSIL